MLVCRAHLFDHLVGAGEQRWWHVEAEHCAVWRLMTSSNLVDCTDRQVGRLRALEDAADVDAGLTIGIVDVGPVAHQPTDFGKVARHTYGGNRVACRQVGELDSPVGEEGVGADEQCVGALARKGFEGRIDLTAGAGVEDLDLQPQRAQPLPPLSPWTRHAR